MKKSILLASLVLLTTLSLSAQKTEMPKMPVKSLFTLDFIGQGTLISLNFDQILHESKEGFLSGRIGVGIPNSGISIGLFGEKSESKGIGFPHSVSWSFGKKHGLELGAGGILSMVENEINYAFYPILGYRYQPQMWHKVQMSFRAYIHPVDADEFLFPIGMGVGFALPGRKR